jgi:nucleotide-binding universal stress UspA family protein
VEKLTSLLAVVDDPASARTLLEKAVFIARCFGARVDLLVADSTQAHELLARCEERHYDEVTLCSAHRGAESLNDVVIRWTLQKRPDLVVKNCPGRSKAGDRTLREADWQLATECAAPLLLVTAMPWLQPMNFGAAVDVSDADSERMTRTILQAAGLLSLGCRSDLDILYSERELRDETLKMERAVKIAQLVREFRVAGERLKILEGARETMLPNVVATRHYDVLVLGAADELAKTMFECSESDIVLVKAGERTMTRAFSGEPSPRHQRSRELEQFV